MNIKKIAGENIRGFRTTLNWSQEKLAGESGLFYTYIGKVERAEATISITNLAKIAKALGVEPITLLTKDAFFHPGKFQKIIAKRK